MLQVNSHFSEHQIAKGKTLHVKILSIILIWRVDCLNYFGSVLLRDEAMSFVEETSSST